MIEVVKWYISSFSASRKVRFYLVIDRTPSNKGFCLQAGTPKKPYNPVLGEIFRCYWDLPESKRTPPNLTEKVSKEFQIFLPGHEVEGPVV